MTSRIVILYDQPSPLFPWTAEADPMVTLHVVKGYLTEEGYHVSLVPVGEDPAPVLAALRELEPDAIFNLCEGSVERPENEAFTASLVEWLNIPATGCPEIPMRLCLNKPLAKLLLRGAALPTPDFFVVEGRSTTPCPLPWPVIVKPAAQDGSAGIEQASVVTSQRQMEERIDWVVREYGGPVLIEEFVSGRELKVGMIELPDLRPLPISEIRHLDGANGYWPVVTYEAKWETGSRDDLATPRCIPDDLPPALVEKLQTMALKAFRLFGCRDFASVDFRLDKNGEPTILEVNPNPDFNPGAGFAAQLEAAGLTHRQFTLELVRAALRRPRWRPVPPTTPALATVAPVPNPSLA